MISSRYAAFYLYPDTAGGFLGQQGLHLGICGVMMFSCLFARAFLNTQTLVPTVDRVLQGLAWFFLGAMVLMPLFGIGHINYIVYQVIAIPVMLGAGYMAMKKGYRPAKFYLISWSFFIIGAGVWIAANLGLVDFTYYLSYAPGYGTAAECLLLAIALGDKMRLEQESAKREIEDLNTELAMRLEDIKEKEHARTLFFNNTSHELRTPLHGILGYLDMIQRDFHRTLPQEVSHSLDKIRSLAGGLTELVNTILHLARAKKDGVILKVSKVSLNRLAGDIKSLAEGLQLHYGNSKFELQTSWTPLGKPHFRTDRLLLLTMIRNLLGNAFKFSDASRLNEVSLAMKITDQHLHLEISDRGIGLSEEDQKLVFEEFKQVEGQAQRRYEGTGLGLPMVQSIVDAMKGQLTLKSKEGVGTTINLVLPPLKLQTEPIDASAIAKPLDMVMLRGKQGEIAARPEAEGVIEPGRKTILVVDDNVANVEVSVSLMRSQGYHVLWAYHGKAALEIIAKKNVDLVLLDLMMPEMSGEEVLQEIRKTPKGRSLPVIVLTARASEEDRLRGLDLSCDGYLAKPIDAKELAVQVRNILERLQHAQDVGKLMQMIESEKIMGLGIMAAGIAHEINNPLAIIMGYVSHLRRMIAECGAKDPKVASIMDRIETTTKRIAAIVASLKAYGRDSSHDPFKIVSLAQIVENALELCRSMLKDEGIELCVCPIPETLTVPCRESQIMQIVVNLVKNAKDALKGLDLKWISIEVKERSECFDIVVTDSGSGIDPSLVHRIFDPFFTLKDVGKGTGLGLALSKSFAQAHHGDLKVNQRCENTQFILSLPKRLPESLREAS